MKSSGCLVKVGPEQGTDAYTISANGRSLLEGHWLKAGTILLWIGSHKKIIEQTDNAKMIIEYTTDPYTNYDKCLYEDRMVAVWRYDIKEIRNGNV